MVGTRFQSWPSDAANPRRERPEPKILYEWTFPAGCGYACRVVETEPGIVQMQQRPLDIETEAWETVPCAMGAANELIHLWQEVEDWRCHERGPGVAGDEDGCCANCGADLEIERRSPAPTTAGTQRGTT